MRQRPLRDAEISGAEASWRSVPFNRRAAAMECRRSKRPVSVRFDARELDHFSPLLGFGGDELLAFGRRHWHRYDAEVGKPCLEPRVAKNGIDLIVEHRGDLGGRAFRRTQPL